MGIGRVSPSDYIPESTNLRDLSEVAAEGRSAALRPLFSLRTWPDRGPVCATEGAPCASDRTISLAGRFSQVVRRKRTACPTLMPVRSNYITVRVTHPGEELGGQRGTGMNGSYRSRKLDLYTLRLVVDLASWRASAMKRSSSVDEACRGAGSRVLAELAKDLEAVATEIELRDAENVSWTSRRYGVEPAIRLHLEAAIAAASEGN